ncbi:MAG: hypothetical protein DDT32_02002 [Syntrophomonadaceae bacterium]|nr:hypothetical protein [Bacillota bacterium]
MFRKKKRGPVVQDRVEHSIAGSVPDTLDIIAPDGVRVEDDSICVGDRFLRVYAVTMLPSMIQVGFLDRLYSTGDIDVSIHIHPGELREVVNELTKKITALESQRLLEERRGDIMNQGILNRAVEDAWRLRDSLQMNQDRVFFVTILFTIAADTQPDLDRASRDIEESLAGQAVHIRRLFLRQDHGLKSVTPCGENHIQDIYRTFNSGAVSALFPFATADLSHTGGVLLGVNGYTNAPVFFDPYNNNNYNMAILATSGAGKTFFMKMFTARSTLHGVRTVLIDPEGEYEALTHQLGGIYVRFDPDGDAVINPFDVEVDNETGLLGLRSKYLELKGLFSAISEMSGSGPARGGDAALLEDAIRSLYEELGITDDPASLEEPILEPGRIGTQRKNMPTISGLCARLLTLGATDLAQVLKPLTKGGTVDIFDGQSAVRPGDAVVTCFDVSRLDEKFLRPIAMHITLAWIWEKFIKRGDRQVRKRVVVDEAWKFMKYKESADFLEEMARRARKRKAGLCIASQSQQEFMESPQGRALVSNSETVILMRQHSSHLNEIQAIFGLPDGQREILRQLPVGAALLRIGTSATVVRFEATARERVFLEAGSR